MKANIKKITEHIRTFNPDKKQRVILGLGLLGIILVVMSSIGDGEEKNTVQMNGSEGIGFNESEYTSSLESRLEDMVSSLYGAGVSKVTVTLECDYETVYARDTGYSKDDNSSDEDSEYIIIDSSEEEAGLVLKTVTPKVRGVAVLCSGGDNPQIQSAVTDMLCALLDIGTNDISVSKIQNTYNEEK